MNKISVKALTCYIITTSEQVSISNAHTSPYHKNLLFLQSPKYHINSEKHTKSNIVLTLQWSEYLHGKNTFCPNPCFYSLLRKKILFCRSFQLFTRIMVQFWRLEYRMNLASYTEQVRALVNGYLYCYGDYLYKDERNNYL